MLKLDYPLVGDAFDPMGAACQSHTLLHLRVFFFSTPDLFRAQDGTVEMTPKSLILRLPQSVMHMRAWIENKVGVSVENTFKK